MSKMAQLRRGLEDAWHSVAEGWQHLRERAAGALTRFTPGTPPAAGGPASGNMSGFQAASWALLAGDVFEDGEKVVVRLEAPGMEKEDFDLEVRDDALFISGEKRYEEEHSEGHYRVRQCAYGSFRRVIPLPVAVQAEKAAASYRNGVLRVELPKAEQAKARRIEVRAV